MLDKPISTLINLLNKSVLKITDNFNGDWLILDPGVQNNGYDNWDSKMQPEYVQTWDTEQHSYIEISLCARGNYAVRIQDHIHDLNEGDVCLVFPELVHAEMVKNDQDYTAIWLAIHMGTLRVHLSGKNHYDSFFVADEFFIEFEHAYNFLLSTLSNQNKQPAVFHQQLLKACIMQILIMVLRKTKDDKIKELDYEDWKELVAIDVRRFIETNYNRPIRLSDVSEQVCISSNYLNTLFKGVTGKTIMQYLEQYRMEKAMHMLSNTHDTIKDIASQLGYYDQYHFSKAFKRETGISPSGYRSVLFDSNKSGQGKSEDV